MLFDFKRGARRRPENENKSVTAARKERAEVGRGGAESERYVSARVGSSIWADERRDSVHLRKQSNAKE